MFTHASVCGKHPALGAVGHAVAGHMRHPGLWAPEPRLPTSLVGRLTCASPPLPPPLSCASHPPHLMSSLLRVQHRRVPWPLFPIGHSRATREGAPSSGASGARKALCHAARNAGSLTWRSRRGLTCPTASCACSWTTPRCATPPYHARLHASMPPSRLQCLHADPPLPLAFPCLGG